MKTIRELFARYQVTDMAPDVLLAALEAREKERDAAERERVKAFLEANVVSVKAWCGKANHTIEFGGKDLAMQLYRPPEPKKLPAGYWWIRRKDEPNSTWGCRYWSMDFAPDDILFEYRRGDDPPPEVTGKEK